MWPRLLRRGGADVDEESEQLLDHERSNDDDDEQDSDSNDADRLIKVDEDQVLLDFKNLYWTRLMS